MAASEVPEAQPADVRVSHRDGVRVVAVSGALDLLAVPALESVLAHPGQAAVVDCRRCTFVDSLGLAALLGARQRCFTAGYGFALVLDELGLLARLLRTTGTADVLAAYPDVERALAAVRG